MHRRSLALPFYDKGQVHSRTPTGGLPRLIACHPGSADSLPIRSAGASLPRVHMHKVLDIANRLKSLVERMALTIYGHCFQQLKKLTPLGEYFTPRIPDE